MRYRLFGFALLAFFLSFISSFILNRAFYDEQDIDRFQNKLHKKYDQLNNYIDRSDHLPSEELSEEIRDNGFVLVVYKEDSLEYWSDNSINFPLHYHDTIYAEGLVLKSNKWMIVKRYHAGEYTLFGFIKIKNKYPHQNEFLQNTFHDDFNLPASAEILIQTDEISYAINDPDGEYLFSIRFHNEKKLVSLRETLVSIFYFLGIVLLLVFIYRSTKIKDARGRNLTVTGLSFAIILVRWFMLFKEFPPFLQDLEIFNPMIYARSVFIPSLGDLLINTVLLFFIVLLLNTRFYISPSLVSEVKSRGYGIIVILMVLCVSFILYSHMILRSLIIDSSISFKLHEVTGLSLYTLVALFVFLLHLIPIILLFDKVFIVCRGTCRLERIILIFTLIFISGILVCFFIGYVIDTLSAFFFFIFFIFYSLLRYKKDRFPKYSSQVFLVFFLAVFSSYFIGYYNSQKTRYRQKVLAENLANEHDPVAEYLLEEMSMNLAKDKQLSNMLIDYSVTIEEIYTHLQRNYFTGFWGKYNLSQITICQPDDSVYLKPPDDFSVNCYGFFDSMLVNSGVSIPNTSFYFIDNQNGRISYLGVIPYVFPDQEEEITLYIEIDSRLVNVFLGYPELLLDERITREVAASDFSFAKYYNNELITQSGEYHYSLNPDVYGDFTEAFTYIEFDDYEHMVYRMNGDNLIVISYRSPRVLDYLISFSYIFVFYYLLIAFYVLMLNIVSAKRTFEFNFKNKIQFAIIAILLISLIIIGGGTIYFSIKQYKQQQLNSLLERMQSVYIELDHKLAFEDELSPYWYSSGYDNLDQLLIKFSNVFYSDINLYAPDGGLLATSREDIFDLGLQGNMINFHAFKEMAVDKRAQYVHEEKIGRLKYLSGYVPFVNYQNKLLAYLNLPYFTKQAEIQKDVSTLIVTMLNIYVLLTLLTVIVAVFISGQITRPLYLIRKKFGEIKLGKKYERIQYDGKDEIGDLVSEYNRMVNELEHSVELLARSEREIAWREMAKQIAHEIKNPLTPMKLSVQQLQRAWCDGKEDYDAYLKQVSVTLIEQIDNLSTIASEFSNFAKMPKARFQKIDLLKVIKSAAELFSNTENTTIKTDFHGSRLVLVYADREQLTRVFINVIKNGIQSIPEKREGLINIDLTVEGDYAKVKVTDNGRGIPDNQKDKLFMPNFTTKTSGMGLGLAIVKNIIDNIGGRISFTTVLDKGTTFIIELPVVD